MVSIRSDPVLRRLSVVVLSHNRESEIRRNLPLLCALASGAKFQVIVVDNASVDGSREFLRSLEGTSDNIEVIFNAENLGVAGGRNTGGNRAKGDFIIFLDDDSRINMAAIQALTNYMAKHPEVGVASPRVVHAETRAPQNEHGELECEVGNYHGSCHIVAGHVYREVGAIDALCNFGGEELDYSIRVRAAGYKVVYLPSVIVGHNNYARSGHEGRWRRERRVYNFSRIHFKHFPWRTASMLSFRYLLSHIYTGVRVFGTGMFFRLPRQAWHGAMEGRKEYQPLPPSVIQFYSAPDLRPDFGNIPLTRKIFGRTGMNVGRRAHG